VSESDRETQDGLCEERCKLYALNGCDKQDRRRPTWHKIVLQRDLRGARVCCGLALPYVGVWRHTSLIQVKARAQCSEGHWYCLSLFSLSLLLRATPIPVCKALPVRTHRLSLRWTQKQRQHPHPSEKS